MKLFAVGKHLDNEDNNEWEMCGVFDCEQLAKKECLNYRYFIGPLELNKAFPHETCEWPNAYYPIVKET